MGENTANTKTVDGSGELNHQAGTPHFLSVADLMMRTGVSRSGINRGIKAGMIPVARVGKRVLIPFSYIENLQAIAEESAKEKQNEKFGQ